MKFKGVLKKDYRITDSPNAWTGAYGKDLMAITAPRSTIWLNLDDYGYGLETMVFHIFRNRFDHTMELK